MAKDMSDEKKFHKFMRNLALLYIVFLLIAVGILVFTVTSLPTPSLLALGAVIISVVLVMRIFIISRA